MGQIKHKMLFYLQTNTVANRILTLRMNGYRNLATHSSSLVARLEAAQSRYLKTKMIEKTLAKGYVVATKR